MFRGKVVVITGAGSGIGQALAVQLGSRGAHLALVDISRTGLAATVANLPSGCRVMTYPLDVASREAVFGLGDAVKRDFGAAHYLFNNAGTSILASFEHTSIAEIEKVLAINLWGVIYGTKAFLPIMLAQREGCIVNISSVLGLLAAPCHAAYVMSKFAVRGLTETLWTELEGTGVRAVVVHPGGINTSIAENSPVAEHETELERHVAAVARQLLVTSPDRCAKLILSGLATGKRRLLVGSGARFSYWLARLLPTGYVGLMRRHYSMRTR
ncbi:MAG: SDR family oxidoreductase [Steroidobacteraceae bacterium]